IGLARENVAMYETVGSEELIELQHLLAVVIGSKRATPELTGKLASVGVEYLANMSVQELELFGLTHLEALKVHASLILAKKLNRARSEEAPVIRSPEDVADYLMPRMKDLKQEHFVLLCLDTKNRIIKDTTVFIGSLSSAIVHPREIFKEALKHSSASIMVAHNHPSGDPSPSRE